MGQSTQESQAGQILSLRGLVNAEIAQHQKILTPTRVLMLIYQYMAKSDLRASDGGKDLPKWQMIGAYN